MEQSLAATQDKRPHVVIVGGGFGGLTAAQSLARAPVRVTLIDRTNHHLFQPLLYQVATAGLSPAEIAAPIRAVLRHQRNATVLLDEVLAVHLDEKRLALRELGSLAYDYLILATGAETNYFGKDEWAQHAPGLKNLDEAVELRRRVLLAFESAERETDPERRAALLTFVSIGGGPTGVEMAGAIAELSRFVLARDFRSIKPQSMRVLLLEAGDRILSAFPPDLSRKAVSQLEGLGVDVRTGARVTRITEEAVYLGEEKIPTFTVLWAAGVRATPLTKTLGVPLDRAGRVLVETDASIPGHPEAFAIGDMATLNDRDGTPLPGVSPVAMQQARSVAKNIVRSIRGQARVPFAYFDKGSMATIGRSRAVATTGKLHLSGLLAWLTWLLVHIFYLIGFHNRLLVLIDWGWSYVTYARGSRLITGQRLEAGTPTRELMTPSPDHVLVAPSPDGAGARPAPPASS